MVKDLLCMDELETNKLYPVPADTQQQIKDFHQEVQAMPESVGSSDDGVTHYVNGGMYAREMVMPAGMVIIGKIYTQDHICIVTKGVIDVVDSFGKRRIKAPFTLTGKAGTQRVGITLEDTVWTTITATELKEPEAIMNSITTTDYKYFKELL